MEMEVGDCSLWHYLIFCEEFVTDDYENDVICWVCQATVLGHPAFKCLECHFFQHKSCTQLPDLTEMEDEHDITKRHHLIMREEMKNNKKEKEVCMGCGKVASGTAFKCSVPQCTFHLHKSCDQLPHAMQHIVHPDHILLLKLPSSYVSCNLCGKYRQRHPLLYNCCLCNFDGDVKCVFRSKVPDNCHPHTFTGSRKPHKFTCETCGEETEDIVHQCRDCGVRTHTWCTRFPDIISIKIHNHLFARAYCLRQVKKLEKAICKLCCKKVNTECGAYYCQVCDYIVHMYCAKTNEDESPLNAEGPEFDDYLKHLVYLIEGLNVEEEKTADAPSKIHHYSDSQHELILNYEDLHNDKRCKACMQFIISAPFYCCDECNIFLHKRCVQVPEIIWRKTFSILPCTLSSQPPETDKLFLCARCLRYRQGFFYEYEDDYGKFRDDVQCFLIPETISHESHGHFLHIPFVIEKDVKEICPGCGTEICGENWRMVCSDCKFWLCFTCATIPLVARYRYRPHLLKLTYACKDDLEECYCLICEGKREPKYWFYFCEDCDFTAHIQCVIGSPLKRGNHQHLIVVVQGVKNFPTCHSCEQGISDDLSIECTQCKFNFYIECYYSI